MIPANAPYATVLWVYLQDGSSFPALPRELERLETLMRQYVAGQIGDRLVEIHLITGDSAWEKLSSLNSFSLSTPAGRRKRAEFEAFQQEESKQLAKEFGLHGDSDDGEAWKQG